MTCFALPARPSSQFCTLEGLTVYSSKMEHDHTPTQTKDTAKTSINHPTSLFQLFGVDTVKTEIQTAQKPNWVNVNTPYGPMYNSSCALLRTLFQVVHYGCCTALRHSPKITRPSTTPKLRIVPQIMSRIPWYYKEHSFILKAFKDIPYTVTQEALYQYIIYGTFLNSGLLEDLCPRVLHVDDELRLAAARLAKSAPKAPSSLSMGPSRAVLGRTDPWS